KIADLGGVNGNLKVNIDRKVLLSNPIGQALLAPVVAFSNTATGSFDKRLNLGNRRVNVYFEVWVQQHHQLVILVHEILSLANPIFIGVRSFRRGAQKG